MEYSFPDEVKDAQKVFSTEKTNKRWFKVYPTEAQISPVIKAPGPSEPLLARSPLEGQLQHNGQYVWVPEPIQRNPKDVLPTQGVQGSTN